MSAPQAERRLSKLYDALQVDFMTEISGIASFESLRARATPVDFDGHFVLVASLEAIIESKQAAGRPQDLAILDILKKSLHETRQPQNETRRVKKRK